MFYTSKKYARNAFTWAHRKVNVGGGDFKENFVDEKKRIGIDFKDE